MSATVTKADLPEVIEEGEVLIVDGCYYTVQGQWSNSELWRAGGMARIAIAEYLDSLKPKLPTTPGSVILATNTGFGTKTPDGEVYLVLDSFGKWNALDGLLTGIPIGHIEDWKPVQLNVVEVSS